MFWSFIESCIRNISGRPGIWIRRVYYSMRLGKCGNKLMISQGVYLDNPKNIFLGDNVWIDRNVILIAGKIHGEDTIKRSGDFDDQLEGKISIGSDSHIGIGTVMQGHGGIRIGNAFTSSAYCTIYSVSNDPYHCRYGTMPNAKEKAYAFANQIIIGDNVWLGLHVSVVKGHVGSDVFVRSHSIVSCDLPDNAIVSGDPASKTKNRFD